MNKTTVYLTKNEKSSPKAIKQKVLAKKNVKLTFNKEQWNSVKTNKVIVFNGIDVNTEEEVQVTLKKRNILLPLILLLLLAAIVGGLFYLKNRPMNIISPDIAVSEKDAQNIDKNELKKRMQAEVDENTYRLQINSNLTFNDNTSEGTIGVVNAEDNTFNVEVKYYVDDQLVYETGLIKPGQYVSKGKLAIALEKGTYNGTAQIFIYDQDGNLQNNPSADFTLTIVN